MLYVVVMTAAVKILSGKKKLHVVNRRLVTLNVIGNLSNIQKETRKKTENVQECIGAK